MNQLQLIERIDELMAKPDKVRFTALIRSKHSQLMVELGVENSYHKYTCLCRAGNKFPLSSIPVLAWEADFRDLVLSTRS